MAGSCQQGSALVLASSLAQDCPSFTTSGHLLKIFVSMDGDRNPLLQKNQECRRFFLSSISKQENTFLKKPRLSKGQYAGLHNFPNGSIKIIQVLSQLKNQVILVGSNEYYFFKVAKNRKVTAFSTSFGQNSW